jgi:peptidoglycan/xylan/chitin deacetylase (PgdA/CDA1 family)
MTSSPSASSDRLRIVTTSWDDGDPSDLRVAELLYARGLGGTFYVPITYEGHQVLDESDVRSLNRSGFEVGGHGFSHKVLPQLSSEEIARELRICRNRLEDVLGDGVRMFCYPKGRFSPKVIGHAKAAGYEGARTTRMFRQELDFDPFHMPTTLHAYPNTKMQYAKNLLRGGNLRGLLGYASRFTWRQSWVTMAKMLFDRVLEEGGIWHLYGHSWLVKEMNLWDDLKQVLDYVSGREGVLHVTNAEVLPYLPRNVPATSPALDLTPLK